MSKSNSVLEKSVDLLQDKSWYERVLVCLGDLWKELPLCLPALNQSRMCWYFRDFHVGCVDVIPPTETDDPPGAVALVRAAHALGATQGTIATVPIHAITTCFKWHWIHSWKRMVFHSNAFLEPWQNKMSFASNPWRNRGALWFVVWMSWSGTAWRTLLHDAWHCHGCQRFIAPLHTLVELKMIWVR